MKTISKSRAEILFIVLLCLFAFFLRSFALYRDLFFAFDQGRDAWEMVKIAKGDLTLIGPVTGLSGVFLGPFWYYFIYPWYVVGGGNPVVAAFGMAGLHALTVGAMYLFARRIAGPVAGAFAAIMFTFSFTNIMFSRWLSNPTPLPFFSLLFFFLLWQALSARRKIIFVVAGITLGICLQLEAANAVWYIPTTALIFGIEFVLLWRNKKKEWKNQLLPFVASGVLLLMGFCLTLVPQFLFELKSHFLLTGNVIAAFRTTHNITLLESLPRRIPLLFSLYAKGLFPRAPILFASVSLATIALGYVYRRALLSNRGFRIALCWFTVPLIFHILYTGNYGNFWDYYIIAQHAALYIVIASVIGISWIQQSRRWWFTAVVTLGILTAVGLNLQQWKGFLTPYENRFSFQMQVEAVNWVLDDSKGQKFGSWIYTPDHQDQAHRYVYHWVGEKRGRVPEEHVEQQPLIYLIVEDDDGHAKRRADWIADKETNFGQIVATKKFGAMTVFKILNTFEGAKGVQ